MAKHEFLEDSKDSSRDRGESKAVDKSESETSPEGKNFAQLDIQEDVADRRDELVGRLMKWYDNVVEGCELDDQEGTESSPGKKALKKGLSKSMVDCGRH